MIKTIFDCDHRNFVKNRLFALPVHFFCKKYYHFIKKEMGNYSKGRGDWFFRGPKNGETIQGGKQI